MMRETQEQLRKEYEEQGPPKVIKAGTITKHLNADAKDVYIRQPGGNVICGV